MFRGNEKGKWKSLIRKILKGIKSIDQEHHNITFLLCDPRLGELSVFAKTNKTMAKGLDQGNMMALKDHGAMLTVDQ